MRGLALLLLAASAQAAETAAFLNIQPGARPMGLGEAYTAVADDLNALTTNPSGLGRMATPQASFMHAELFGGARYDSAAFGQPLGRGGESAFGVAVQRLAQGGLEGRDENGAKTGSFAAGDTAFNLGVSRWIGSSLSLGANVKYVESRLADASARTFAADLGAQKSLTAGGLPLTLGVSVRNLGPGLKYAEETNALPRRVSGGAATRFFGMLLVSAEVSDDGSFGVGSEYAILPAFAVRAGYGQALGMGFSTKLRAVSIDYSFTPSSELGNTQRLTFTTRFAPSGSRH